MIQQTPFRHFLRFTGLPALGLVTLLWSSASCANRSRSDLSNAHVTTAARNRAPISTEPVSAENTKPHPIPQTELSRPRVATSAPLAGGKNQTAPSAEARLSEGYGKLPLSFELNQGQTDQQVKFLARGPGYGLFLTSTEAVLTLPKNVTPASSSKRKKSHRAIAHSETAALRMKLIGSNPNPDVHGLEELPGKANYFVGHDEKNWRTNVSTYAKVRYENVYPGVDLVYYGNQRQLEYDLVVAPGADPKRIKWGFRGAGKPEIDGSGDLVLHMAGRELRQHKPLIYQEVDGVRQPIAGGYVLNGTQVGFQVAEYDRARPLVIDPTLVYSLAYSTYLGGSGYDQGLAIAVDAAGNAYVTGYTQSSDFPTFPPAIRKRE